MGDITKVDEINKMRSETFCFWVIKHDRRIEKLNRQVDEAKSAEGGLAAFVRYSSGLV